MPSRATDTARPAGPRQPASATAAAAAKYATAAAKPAATYATAAAQPAATYATAVTPAATYATAVTPATAGHRLAAAAAAAAIACLAWLALPTAWTPALAAARPAASTAAGTTARMTMTARMTQARVPRARAARARLRRARVTAPTPALSIASTSPVLVQTGPSTWITTILVADSGAPARAITYKLVPIVPSHRLVTGTVIACIPGTAHHCPLALDQVTRVRIRFHARFPVPLAQAALIIDGHPGAAKSTAATLVPQEVQLAIQRQVGPWFDLAAPLAVAAALAVLTIALILLLARRISPAPGTGAGAADPHPPAVRPSMANGDPMTSLTAPAVAVGEHVIEIYGTEATITELGADPAAGSGSYSGAGRGPAASPSEGQPAPTKRPGQEPARRQPFVRREIYASASWSFKDSWATNITALGGAVGAIAAAAGATSTVFPGVALDRFAILLALFAAVVVMGPLVLGLCLPRSDDVDRVKATGFSLLVAAFVTLIGVGGEIGTIGSLIWLSSPARGTRMALLLLPAAAFVVVTWYACRTTVELAAHSRPGGSQHHSSALTAGKDSAITL